MEAGLFPIFRALLGALSFSPQLWNNAFSKGRLFICGIIPTFRIRLSRRRTNAARGALLKAPAQKGKSSRFLCCFLMGKGFSSAFSLPFGMRSCGRFLVRRRSPDKKSASPQATAIFFTLVCCRRAFLLKRTFLCHTTAHKAPLYGRRYAECSAGCFSLCTLFGFSIEPEQKSASFALAGPMSS